MSRPRRRPPAPRPPILVRTLAHADAVGSAPAPARRPHHVIHVLPHLVVATDPLEDALLRVALLRA